MVSNPKYCKSWPHAGWQNRWFSGNFSSFSWFWLAGCHPIFHWNKKSTDHFGQQSMLSWRLHRESNPELSLRRTPLYPFNYEDKCRIFGLFQPFCFFHPIYGRDFLWSHLYNFLTVDFRLRYSIRTYHNRFLVSPVDRYVCPLGGGRSILLSYRDMQSKKLRYISYQTEAGKSRNRNF